MAGRNRPSEGFVLVSVLWLVLLLSFIAAAMSYSNHLELRGQRALMQGVQARYLADGGVHLMLSTLLAARDQNAVLGDGEAVPLTVAGHELSVSVSDENGKVDINAADAALISRLLIALEVDKKSAEALADAIVDYRDVDSLRHAKGAEDEDYLAAGLAWGAKNDWFTGLEELRNVYGMTDEIYRAILPYVTIYSSEKGVNPLVAPLEVLMALSDDSRLSLQRYIDQRRDFQRQGLVPQPLATVPREWLTNTRGITYSLVANVSLTEDSSTSVRALVRLPRQGTQDTIEIIEWRPYAAPLVVDE